MKNLSHLASDSLALIEKIEQATIAKSKEFTLAFVGEATEISPVDTSKLISNYQVSVGDNIDSEIPAHEEGKFGSTKLQSAGISYLEAQAELQFKTKVGQNIFIANRVDYLDEQIALKGNFVKASVEIASAIVEATGLQIGS